MAQWGKLSYTQKSCLGCVGKLMKEAGMLRPGAKVGVAVSGGVDSFFMLKILTLRKRIAPFHFDIMALHVNPGFDPDNHAPLADWVRQEGLAAHMEVSDHGPRAHSDENRKKSACFYCAMLRRKRLFDLCKQYGLTHLAFGHTTDDLATTFFMNMVQTGKVDTLPPTADFFGGELRVIRPLLFLEKTKIVKAAREFGLPWFGNPCPSAPLNKRADIAKRLDCFLEGEKGSKKNVMNALRRFVLDLPPKSA